MARYIDHDGTEVEAFCLDEDRPVDARGTVGRRGEWCIHRPVPGGFKLTPDLCAANVFPTRFRQKFPRSTEPSAAVAMTPPASPPPAAG